MDLWKAAAEAEARRHKRTAALGGTADVPKDAATADGAKGASSGTGASSGDPPRLEPAAPDEPAARLPAA